MVSPKMMIQDLKRCLPNPDCDLVFAGATLMESFPLDFYSVGDGDFLIALSKSSEYVGAWTHVTEDNEAFGERMRMMGNPKVAREYARLRDLKVMKLRNKPSLLSRLDAINSQYEQIKRPQEKTVLGERAKAPNEDPLPSLMSLAC